MSETASETRISTLIGDRLCIKCGYNLVGQPIFREEHYDMFIVRCPECATVASLQEYPLLGRWASLLAGLWLLILLALWAGSGAAIFGLSLGAAELACERYSEAIYARFATWQSQQAAAGSNAGMTTITRPGGQIVAVNNLTTFDAWWQQQDPRALLADVGGRFGGVSSYVWVVWFWEVFVALMLGVMWATLMFAQKWRGLLMWSLLIMAGAMALAAIPLTDWYSGQPRWMYQASRMQIGPVMLGVSLAWGWLCLSIGMLIGRPVARGLIRLMLPPRLRSSLAFLWLADGREPPLVGPGT